MPKPAFLLKNFPLALPFFRGAPVCLIGDALHLGFFSRPAPLFSLRPRFDLGLLAFLLLPIPASLHRYALRLGFSHTALLLSRFGRLLPFLLFLIPACLLRDALRLGFFGGPLLFSLESGFCFCLRLLLVFLLLIPACLLRDAPRLYFLGGSTLRRRSPGLL